VSGSRLCVGFPAGGGLRGMDELFVIDDTGDDIEFSSGGRGRICAKLPYGGPEVRIGAGDFVLLRAEVGTDAKPFVAEVRRVTLRRKRGEREPTLRFVGRWFYRGQELRTSLADSVVPGDAEVFETELEDEHDADVIVGRCAVLSFREFVERSRAGGEPAGTLLYCRFRYDGVTAELFPSAIDFVGAPEAAAGAGDGNGPEHANGGPEYEPAAVSSGSESDGDANDDEEVGARRRLRKRPRTDRYQFSLPTAGGTVLVCREDERRAIEDFVVDVLGQDSRGGSRCLYISGVPGTGKTATVRGVLSSLLERSRRGEIGPMKVADVNGMALLDHNATYSILLRAVRSSGSTAAPMNAVGLLDRVFRRGRAGQPLVVLVLDEMDTLMTRRQKLLYDLFEWTTQEAARLAIVGIANTMDLPERVLPRITSRLGLNRLVFPPYTSPQLSTILSTAVLPQLVGAEDVHRRFEPHAVDLCAKKVAAVSGDVRSAVEICRRALLLAADADRVTAMHVNDAALELSGWGVRSAVRNLSAHERAVLDTAAAITREVGTEIASHVLLSRSCATYDVSSTALRAAMRRLIAGSFLSRVDSGTVALNVSIDDLVTA